MITRERQLGDFLRIAHGFAFKGEYFSDSGKYVVLTPGNFHESGGFRARPGKDRSYTARFPERYLLRKGDLIIAMTEQGEGLLGSAALIPENGIYLHNQRIALASVDPKSGERRYFYYLLNSIPVRQQIRNSSSGTKVRHTSPERICQATAPIPAVNVQRKIAAVLSAYDDLIENNRRRIALLERMAEQLYREWFVRFRFPGYHQAKFDKGIPSGWVPGKLSDVAVVNARSLKRGHEPEVVRYVDIGAVTTNAVEIPEPVRFRDAPGRARRCVRHGDMLWSSVRPANRAYCLILEPPENLIASTGFAVISPRVEVPFSFIKFVTTTDSFVEQMTAIAKGAAYPATSFDDFENATLLIPPPDLLREFHKRVLPMLSLSHKLRAQNEVLARARDLLLPRLISGKLRVDDLDIQFPPSMQAARA